MQATLRRKIEQAAKARGESLNSEIVRRLEDSFASEKRAARELVIVSEVMGLMQEAHERAKESGKPRKRRDS